MNRWKDFLKGSPGIKVVPLPHKVPAPQGGEGLPVGYYRAIDESEEIAKLWLRLDDLEERLRHIMNLLGSQMCKTPNISDE